MLSIFRRLVPVRRESQKFIFNLGVDLSSSMRANAQIFSEQYSEMLGKLSLSDGNERTRIRVYEISGFAFHEKHRDKPVVYKRCDLEPPRNIHRYDASEFRMTTEGGILRGGSPLKDGLVRLADRCLTDRMLGHMGPLMLGLFADGYDRGSGSHISDLRRKLDCCREAGIPILVAFFIFGNDLGFIKSFISDAELNESEFFIASYSREEERRIAVNSAFDAMSESISNVTGSF